MKKQKAHSTSSHSPITRIIALAMALLVASGIIVYLITFLIDILS